MVDYSSGDLPDSSVNRCYIAYLLAMEERRAAVQGATRNNQDGQHSRKGHEGILPDLFIFSQQFGTTLLVLAGSHSITQPTLWAGFEQG